MYIDMNRLREDMKAVLRDPDQRPGLEDAVSEYGPEDLDDPDTVLSIARAVGTDLKKYKVGEEAQGAFNIDYDTDQDLDDLNDDVDDLTGDYY